MKPLSDALSKRYVEKLESKTLHCAVHGDYEGGSWRMGGVVHDAICPACEAERLAAKRASEAAEMEERRERARVARYRAAGIPKRFLAKGFDDFAVTTPASAAALLAARRYVDEFDSMYAAGTCLTFLGGPGTGKTHLACTMLRLLHDAGARVLFIETYAMLRRIKSTYRRDSEQTEQQAIDALALLDLLALDEVGVGLGSETDKLLLFEVLNERYKNMLPTLLLSNLSPLEFERYLGARTVDRLAENGGVVVPFTWQSARA